MGRSRLERSGCLAEKAAQADPGSGIGAARSLALASGAKRGATWRSRALGRENSGVL